MYIRSNEKKDQITSILYFYYTVITLLINVVMGSMLSVY